MMPDLKTEAGRAEWNRRLKANTAKLIAEIRADKEKHNGLSATQRTRPRPDRFANSNFGYGF